VDRVGIDSLVAGLVALVVGLAFCFVGCRLFLVLLPIWAGVLGFVAGAQLVAAVLGTGFLADLVGIVAGLAIALGFAIVSYLVYGAAIVALGLFVGYAIGSGLVTWLTGGFDLLAAAAGLVLGVALALGTLALNVPKWAVVAMTAFGGAGLAVAGAFVLAGQIAVTDLESGVVGSLVQASPALLLVVLALALAGIWVQTSRTPGEAAVDVSGYRF
jgi:hypothetical protein